MAVVLLTNVSILLQEVETEDMMDELIGRSLVTSNTSNGDSTKEEDDDEKKTCYFVHDIQLGFIKERMMEKKKIKGFHQLLIQRSVIFFYSFLFNFQDDTNVLGLQPLTKHCHVTPPGGRNRKKTKTIPH